MTYCRDWKIRAFSLLLMWGLPFAFGSPVLAQDETGIETATATEEATDAPTNGAEPATAAPTPVTAEQAKMAADNAAVAANNAWMLISSALVLFMTVPGLAMFYGGLVRKKNVLSVIMQCMFLMGMNAVIWALYGYSLTFGGDCTLKTSQPYEKFVGTGEYLFLQGTQSTWDESTDSRVPAPMFSVMGTNLIPITTHMLFQGMFFIITPALICGAFAERMKFSAMVLFSLIWGTVIYMPLCHMVWDSGYLAWGMPHAIAGGALDFAGGTVVHISSGISALICALVIGKRLGYGREPMPPHNLTYTALGAGMLWVGWFGFNGGSELASDDIAASAFAATHFAAAAAALAWAFAEWLMRGKPSMLGAASGAVAGLVCITPASGFVTPMAAIVMGGAAGIVCFLACTKLKNTFGYDDSLDVFGVHGIGGTLGAILTGVFATRAINDWGSFLDPQNASGIAKAPLGLVDGNTNLIFGQLVAVGITWGYAIVGSFIILKLVDSIVGLRVTVEQEQQGLDITQHGEEGYIFV
jgi:Amt family ammonium transporter